MARGFGRSLDITTLMVLIRHRLTTEGEGAFTTRFDVARGYSAWWGTREPDDAKWFGTFDSALLSLLVGQEAVPGVDE